jgi:hypothetical protein
MRRRHVTGERDLLHARLRIRLRDGRQQGPGVRVLRLFEDLLAGAALHDLAQIHDGDLIGNVLHHR